MTSAYGTSELDIGAKGEQYAERIPYIPLTGEIQGSTVLVDFVRTEEDVNSVFRLLNLAIEEGESWPFRDALSEKNFRRYFFAHTALIVRRESSEVIGTFYCKPNFPGRCAHICNGGFITHPLYRRRGVATLMATVFIRVARDLGFSAAFFNLVFERNMASVRLWEKMGFKRLATIPRAGRLKSGTSDAFQYYFDLEKRQKNGRSWARRIALWSLSRLPLICCTSAIFWVGRICHAPRK